MNIHEGTKVILLPKEKGLYSIIKLPNILDQKSFKSYLLRDDQLFELREIKGDNRYLPNDSKRPVIPNTGLSVKSFIFESEENGCVVQSPNLIVSTKFNLVYYLMSIMYNNDSFAKRFITFEDFSDTISSLFEYNSWVGAIPMKIYKSALSEICETIEENDEIFYKYSNAKVIEYLNRKVSQLLAYLGSQSDLSIIMKIKQELYRPISEGSNDIPSDILQLSIIRHSIDLICGSYTPIEIRNQVMNNEGYEFDKLNAYLKDIQAQRKELELVESNMNAVVETTTKVETKKNDAKKKVVRKKEVKKVAVGKGALDGFFKKAQ